MTTLSDEAPAYALRLSDDERARYRRMAERARTDELALWTAAGIVPGARVADVGCGPGAVLVELARLVAPGGEVVGVEPDAGARAAATEEIATTRVAGARVIEGTATATGLEPASFDVVMVRHVLFHLGAAGAAAVAHSASLLRPAGHLYLVDTDLSVILTCAVEPAVVELAALYRDFQAGRGCAVSVGPQLGAMLLAAGLELVNRSGFLNVGPSTAIATGGVLNAAIPALISAGMASEADADRWRASLRRSSEMPGAAVFIPVFVAVGRAPS